MTVDELMRIVHADGLDAPVLYGEGRLHDDAVVLEREGSSWKVYLVDERSATIESTLRTFRSEDAALEHVLLKLRQVLQARNALARNRTRPESNA